MRTLAREELHALRASQGDLQDKLLRALLPRDESDSRNVVLEVRCHKQILLMLHARVQVRAGTGGDEACLFAADLFMMYRRFAAMQGWRFEELQTAAGDAGGVRFASAAIAGDSVYRRLKYESGVHRVQRVPATENQGRLHTSAASVAVLPQAEEVRG